MSKPNKPKTLVENRRARHEYLLETTFEAGLSLLGSEVKSIRGGQATLAEAYVRLDRFGSAWLIGAHITPYQYATHDQHDPTRKRRLLLHRHELAKLKRGVQQKGMTIIPLRLYLIGSLVKLEIALGKGKKLHDKRSALKQKTAKRMIRKHYT